MDVSVNLPPLPEQPSSSGELVVQTGRQSGTRRPLRRPLTLLGQASGCDVRLNAAGVSPLHCAIVHDQPSPILRDLDSDTGVKVNGHVVRTHRLANGDVVEIGPYQLVVELDTPPTNEGPNADAILFQRERDALRIQVAGVAAQQAALIEEESRLDQRATALELQEIQLAGHLEERQHRLDEEQEQLRQQRASFSEEADTVRQTHTSTTAELAQKQRELDRQKQEIVQQRQRLNDIRRRLWKRYQRHWTANESALKRREATLVSGTDRLQREREKVRAFQERVNGELELGRRQLRQEAEDLALAQKRWEERQQSDRHERERAQAELQRRAAELDARAQAMIDAEKRSHQEQTRLKREVEGLQARIGNQRAQLDALRRDPTVRESATSEVVIPPMSPALPSSAGSAMVPAQLRELAGILSDQRLHLAEQWQKLLDVQESWQEERAAALAELETTAEQLSRRDRELRLAEERTQRNWEDLNRRREELTAAGEALEGWRARQSIEESAWQAQHEALLAAIKEREQLVESRGQQVEEEAHRAERRHEEERTRLEQARARCEEARRQYCNLWQEAEQLQASLAEKERELTGEALALERLRVEVVHSSGNSARVESRLDKLARREVARLDADARHLEAERERLEREHQHLDDESKRLVQFEENLLARQRDWSRQVADWEQQRARADEEEVRRQAELRRLRAQNAVYERQLHQLREEIERLARVLIENAPEPPAQQAA